MTRVSAELHDKFDQAFDLGYLERQANQLTLDHLIATLQSLPPELEMPNLRNPHSYRGYYCELALELRPGSRTVAELLADCIAVSGQPVEPYKGDENIVIEPDVPVWVADQGNEGVPFLAVNPDGSVAMEHEKEPLWDFPKWIKLRVWGEDF